MCYLGVETVVTLGGLAVVTVTGDVLLRTPPKCFVQVMFGLATFVYLRRMGALAKYPADSLRTRLFSLLLGHHVGTPYSHIYLFPYKHAFSLSFPFPPSHLDDLRAFTVDLCAPYLHATERHTTQPPQNRTHPWSRSRIFVTRISRIDISGARSSHVR